MYRTHRMLNRSRVCVCVCVCVRDRKRQKGESGEKEFKTQIHKRKIGNHDGEIKGNFYFPVYILFSF